MAPNTNPEITNAVLLEWTLIVEKASSKIFPRVHLRLFTDEGAGPKDRAPGSLARACRVALTSRCVNDHREGYLRHNALASENQLFHELFRTQSAFLPTAKPGVSDISGSPFGLLSSQYTCP